MARDDGSNLFLQWQPDAYRKPTNSTGYSKTGGEPPVHWPNLACWGFKFIVIYDVRCGANKDMAQLGALKVQSLWCIGKGKHLVQGAKAPKPAKNISAKAFWISCAGLCIVVPKCPAASWWAGQLTCELSGVIMTSCEWQVGCPNHLSKLTCNGSQKGSPSPFSFHK